MHNRFGLFIVVFALQTSGALATEIQSFESGGQLRFGGLENATRYRVEWAPFAGGPWTNFTGDSTVLLDNIAPAGTNAVTVTVPTFFRVIADVAPAPFSNDPLNPSLLSFALGTNIVAGQVANPRNTRDFFRFNVPTGMLLTAIYLVDWTSSGDNIGYMHIDDGTNTVIPSTATTNQFLGGIHLSRSLYAATNNLLPILATAPQGGTGFVAPLGAGDYVVNVQQTGPEESAYALRFVIEAAPLPVVQFNVVNSGFSAYAINGTNNTTLTLTRGRTYQFNISAAGHPFWIKTSATTGTGNAYTNGVSNNGISNGTLTFIVPSDAPTPLHYICQFHSAMKGTINVVGP